MLTADGRSVPQGGRDVVGVGEGGEEVMGQDGELLAGMGCGRGQGSRAGSGSTVAVTLFRVCSVVPNDIEHEGML